jgi:hypothetical protein
MSLKRLLRFRAGVMFAKDGKRKNKKVELKDRQM